MESIERFTMTLGANAFLVEPNNGPAANPVLVTAQGIGQGDSPEVTPPTQSKL